jgi:uncharacterized protein (TIGR02145 family)
MNKLLIICISFICLENTFISAQTYREVKIDGVAWMAENLNVDCFRNGDPIPEAKTTEEWETAIKNKKPAWCYYNNDPSNGDKYGKLYNCYAVNDKRGLAPEGWHIASTRDWNDMVYFLGKEADTVPLHINYTHIEQTATNKIKSKSGWPKGTNGLNESGFTALPGGYRSSSGFQKIGEAGYWHRVYGIEEIFDSTSYYLNEDRFGTIHFSTDYVGLSVRCVKDFGQDASDYTTVVIGDQTWMIDNLNVDKFRNGDIIPQAKTEKEWIKACKKKKPAWCYFKNDRDYQKNVGKLYNYYAISDERGLAPEGWHIPVRDEWQTLIDFCGGDSVAAVKLKDESGWGWWYEDGNGTNESGFSARPNGHRQGDGDFFSQIKIGATYWVQSEYKNLKWLNHVQLYWDSDAVAINKWTSDEGYSVRCVKDK